MISINPDRLYAGYSELKSACASLSAHSSTITDVQNQLPAKSGMDDIRHLLSQTNILVADYIEQYQKLCQSIDTICQLYVSCENRILDSGENAIIHYAQPSATFIDLATAADILHEFSFF